MAGYDGGDKNASVNFGFAAAEGSNWGATRVGLTRGGSSSRGSGFC
jgi:hypothetical protein